MEEQPFSFVFSKTSPSCEIKKRLLERVVSTLLDEKLKPLYLLSKFVASSSFKVPYLLENQRLSLHVRYLCQFCVQVVRLLIVTTP